MKKNLFITKVFLIISLCMLFVPMSWNDGKVTAFTNQVIQQGAVGDDVIELQSRLQYLSFYNGKIDGVFGWGTYWALRNFQYEFGLDIDGIARQGTKDKLVKASNYNESFVKEQIKKGNKFTHYGGTDLEKQTKSTNEGKAKQDTTGAQQNQTGTQQKPSAANMPNGFSQNDIH